MMTALLFSTCGLTTEREQVILVQYNESTREKYADLLVGNDQYTTTGIEYHQKFYKHLIGIATDIVEKKKLVLEKASVGFYYDRVSKDRRKLYLGLDIAAGGEFSQSYEAVAISLIRKDLKEIMQTVNSCRSVYGEHEIVGMVIGWRWKSAGRPEQMNVWILKNDVISFEDGSITFDELLQRSTFTNTAIRVIRLPF